VAAPSPNGPAPARGGLAAYGAALVITVAAVLSQYWLPGAWPALRPLYTSLPGDLAIVYGIPIVAFAALVGTAPLARATASLGRAAVEGLRWYGLLSLLALLVTVLLAIAYLALDPSALTELTRPNPDIQAAGADPWFWIGFSFVIGAIEETIFRGWVFGFWVGRDPARWWGPALGSSVLFTGIHVYYATTYGVAAGLLYPSLFLLALAFAIAYRASGGNLVVIALLHGAFDSAAFLFLVNPDAGNALHYGVILLGLLVAAIVHRRRGSSATAVTHL
jgi:membrane protease YdiL (CAAX protease family)